jgi:hypothetical protein
LSRPWDLGNVTSLTVERSKVRLVAPLVDTERNLVSIRFECDLHVITMELPNCIHYGAERLRMLAEDHADCQWRREHRFEQLIAAIPEPFIGCHSLAQCPKFIGDGRVSIVKLTHGDSPNTAVSYGTCVQWASPSASPLGTATNDYPAGRTVADLAPRTVMSKPSITAIMGEIYPS